jgi:hypothetical protein
MPEPSMLCQRLTNDTSHNSSRKLVIILERPRLGRVTVPGGSVEGMLTAKHLDAVIAEIQGIMVTTQPLLYLNLQLREGYSPHGLLTMPYAANV